MSSVLIAPLVSDTAWHPYFVQKLMEYADSAIIGKRFKYGKGWIEHIKNKYVVKEQKGISEYIITDINRVDTTEVSDGDLVGFSHGGAYEPFDLEYEDAECEAMETENFPRYKTIYVASNHQKKMILDKYPKLTNLLVTAFPYMDYSFNPMYCAKKFAVCYAGQLSEAKGYDVIKDNRNVYALRSHVNNTSKEEYLALVRKFRTMVVPSRKETFGIAPVEAIQNCTIPLMTKGLSLYEIYGDTKSPVWINEPNDIDQAIAWASNLTPGEAIRIIYDLYGSLMKFFSRIDARFL